MPTTAENLRELHALHQRSKSLRDRLASGPKTLTARQAFLTKKKTELEAAKDAIKKLRVDIKNKEGQVQSQKDRADDLRTKLNAVKKQTEYDAIRNEIAHTNQNVTRIEEEVLELMQKVETQEAEVKTFEAEVSKIDQEVAALVKDIAERASAATSQLGELDSALEKAEQIIPEEQRDQYVRSVKGRADDAMAQVEDGACHGCYVAITPQMHNELINGHALVFCKTCGRILYLAEQPERNLKRTSKRA